MRDDRIFDAAFIYSFIENAKLLSNCIAKPRFFSFKQHNHVKCLKTTGEKGYFETEGPRPKKVTGGPRWLRYATARSRFLHRDGGSRDAPSSSSS